MKKIVEEGIKLQRDYILTLNKINALLMKIADQELMAAYNMGWQCELKPELQKAFNIGRMDYIAGDDVSSVDLQTEEEILSKLRKL
jgi:hypothetical protein